MNPLSLLGFGTSLVGGLMGLGASSKIQEAQEHLTGVNMQMEDTRYKAMLLASRRQQTEIIRNAQRVRALALNSSVNQGAQFGSGMQGGLAQVAGEANWMLQGNNQNLEYGKDMFQLNKEATQWKGQLSNAQTDLNTAQGVMSLGGSLINNGPTISKFFNIPNLPNIFGR